MFIKVYSKLYQTCNILILQSEEEARSKKRTKKSNDDKGSNKKAKKETKSNNDEESWDIGGSKMVTVRSFRGKWYVDIREMYLDKGSGEMKPTKKGTITQTVI